MVKRLAVIVSFAIAALATGAFALEQDKGVTSGPSIGKPVMPSTAVQKQNPNIPHLQKKNVPTPSGVTAGEPGVEGKKGTQSGKEAPPPQEGRLR